MPRPRRQKSGKAFKNLVIRASAGTGKTFQLTTRYLQLLHAGVAPDHILATTFTRKAAGEILDRVITRLAEAVFDEAKRCELAKQLGVTRMTREQCQELLIKLLSHLHRLRIGTLDSLFGQLARAFTLEVGLPAAWKIIDEGEEAGLRDLAIDQLLRGEQVTNLVELTQLLSKGGAARSVADLIRDTVANLHELFQETDEAGWQAVPKHRPLESAEFEALLTQLREFPVTAKGQMKPRDQDAANAAASDWESFIAKGLAGKILSDDLTYMKKPIPEELVAIYRRLLDQARAVLVTRLAWQTERSYELLNRFDIERRRLQRQSRGARFDDVTRALDEAMRKSRARAEGSDEEPGLHLGLEHRLDSQLSHLLIDEFQDTAPRQWRALEPLIEPVRRSAETASFFCVGDVKQAIYGWRGGVAEIFQAIEQQIPGLDAERLTHSFRSSRAVIEFVNETFLGLDRYPRQDRATEAVSAWRNGFERHTTARAELPGYACLRTSRAPQEYEKPALAVLDDAASLIAQLHRESPGSEIGVLVMTNAMVGRMSFELRRRNLPASEEGQNPLVDSAAVQWIMSLLRLVDHPGDRVARFHLASSPFGEAVGMTDHRDELAARIVAARLRRELLEDGYGRFVQRVANRLRPACGPRETSRLEQLIEQAFHFQSRATIRTRDFLRHIETHRVAEPMRSPIRVMTVHQAKGLQFDIVVLPQLDDDFMGQPPSFVVERLQPVEPITAVCRYVNSDTQKLLPPRLQNMFAAAADREVAEAMCVLYVALTRAVHALHAVIAPSKSESATFPRSYAGLLRAALAGTQSVLPERILYECGDRNWFEREHAPAIPWPAPDAKREIGVPRDIALAAVPQRRRGLERTSPSSLEGGGRVQVQRWFERQSSDTRIQLAALRGSVIHAWFRRLVWLEEGLPGRPQLRQAAAEVSPELAHAPQTDLWIEQFERFCADEAIAIHLRRASYGQPGQLGFPESLWPQLMRPEVNLEVETELPFALRSGGGLLSGSIDRLVLIRDRERLLAAEVIDFKTDNLAPNDPDAMNRSVDFYRPQIEAYRHAVADLMKLPPGHVIGRLLFVSIGRMTHVGGAAGQ